jgi:hypothetical protein
MRLVTRLGILRTLGGAIGAGALLAACASSDFVSSWKAPDATPLQINGAKVAAMVMMKDESGRRAAELALARELTSRGANGVPSYSIFPDGQPSDEAAVRTALERDGFDGIVTMRPVSTDKEIVSTPPTYSASYYGGFWGGYYPYGWGAAYGPTVVSPGDIRTNTIVTIETMVYSLRQNKLVWAGQSKTTNPSKVDKVVQDMAQKAANELQRQGLLATSSGA